MLTEDVRPKMLSEIIGQARVKKFLRGWLKEYADKGTADAFLIHGPSGSGKTSIAHALCGELGVDWGLKFIGSRECTIEKVREIAEDLSHSMINGELWRVIVIDEAHEMSDPAKNAFLSLLERIPNRRLVVFTTTDPLKFDLVWRSRCKMIAVEALDEEDIITALMKASGDRKCPHSVFIQIARTCAGNLRAALHELEKHLLTVTQDEDDQAKTTEQLVPKMIEQPDGTATMDVPGGKLVITPIFRKPFVKAMQDGDIPAAEIERCRIANAFVNGGRGAVLPNATAPQDACADTLHKPKLSNSLEDFEFIVRPGTKEHYCEVVFDSKPAKEVIERLKAKGFRWSPRNKVWYGKSLDLPLRLKGHLYRDGWSPIEVRPSGVEVVKSRGIAVTDGGTCVVCGEDGRCEGGHSEKEINKGVADYEEFKSKPKVVPQIAPITGMEALGMIRKKPRGLDIVEQDGAYVIVHEASGQDIGFPPFKEYAEAMRIRFKIYDMELADWTRPADEVMAIDGIADKLGELMPEEQEAVAVASSNVIQMPMRPLTAMEKLRASLAKARTLIRR